MNAEETSVVKMFMALEEWAGQQTRRTWSVFRRRPIASHDAFGPQFGCELRWATGAGSMWRVEKSAHTPMLAVVMALEAAIAAETS